MLSRSQTLVGCERLFEAVDEVRAFIQLDENAENEPQEGM
jgi:hypothetical protein